MALKLLSRQELLDLIWSRPMRSAAADLGVSDVALRKAAIRAGLPLPPVGHWNRVHAGKKAPPKPPLPPRRFGAPDEVRFGAERWLYPSQPSPDAPVPPEPVFDEPLDSVRKRAAAAVGSLSVPRDLKSPHPVVRRLLEDEAARAEKVKASPYMAPLYPPRLSMPTDHRRLRLLNAALLGLARADVRASLSSADKLAVHVGAGDLQMACEQARGAGRKTKVNDGLSIFVSRSSSASTQVFAQWDDEPGQRLESIVSEIAVETVVMVEQRYREGCLERHRWLLERRAAIIEEARQARLKAERLERERLEKLERERVERLLHDAERLRQADGIRAFVAEVGRRSSSVEVGVEDYERWRGWAMEQTDRLDPVVGGAYLRSIGDRA